MKFTTAVLLLSLATTAKSWRSVDTATLHFWSPPSLCTQENYDNKNTCSVSESVENINVKLDNTGSICYSNPMSYSSNGSAWFTWLGPGQPGFPDLWTYELWVPKGQPVPQCNERGVCDPCDALDPIRGNDPAGWYSLDWVERLNSTGYSLVGSPSPYCCSVNECAVTSFAYANDVHPNNQCGPFQGNITVEAGVTPDPHACVSRGITTAAKCGEECDDTTLTLKKAVFANDENGEAACCTCTYYDELGMSGVCGTDISLCIANDIPSGSNKVVTIGAMLFVVANAVYFI